MDALQICSWGNDLKPVLKINKICASNLCFIDNLHSVRILEGLQSQRKNEDLCDIRFETDDGTIVFAHKCVLMAASPYFSAMYSNFDESNKDLVDILVKKLDSTALQLLVDYIYTGEIIVTKENVQVLLQSANILQLDFVSAACTKVLQKQLDASNFLGIRALADLHN
ncbi:kelch-like protein 20 [Acyrthosiphon pisum]|uniref:BTB domain-containing protein n=1 Tax=Acyrthosiphon pisum TaxID=7029 RepID=A0A8R2H4E0_ACYPI|nr:kelch-like protein 20 [Acyrthosiphon pisum]|eukprot:XP_016657010.1 PREDICTED: kelch-like protein 20 [Acyrthosiphon pisum]